MYSLAPEVHVQFVYSFNTRLYCFNKLHHYNAKSLPQGSVPFLTKKSVVSWLLRCCACVACRCPRDTSLRVPPARLRVALVNACLACPCARRLTSELGAPIACHIATAGGASSIAGHSPFPADDSNDPSSTSTQTTQHDFTPTQAPAATARTGLPVSGMFPVGVAWTVHGSAPEV